MGRPLSGIRSERAVLLLRMEAGLVGTSLLISGVQYFLTGSGSWGSTLVYTLVAGNVTRALLALAMPLYNVGGPQTWLRYLLVLTPVAMLAALAGGVANRMATGRSLKTLGDGRSSDLPYATLICFAVGVRTYAARRRELALEADKQALAQQVQRGEQALELHEAELKAAYEIQTGLLPKTVPKIAGVEISCAWQPARTVSGDFFDVQVLGEERIGFCVADVSGKGMSAALVTANLQAAFRAFAGAGRSPAEVCGHLNRALCGSLPAGRFVTLVYGVLDRRTMELEYEAAGHGPMLLLREGEVIRLEGTGPVLGLLPEAIFEDQRVSLAMGDRVLVTTDGVTEACGPESEVEFGEERVIAAAREGAGDGVHGMRQAVMGEVGTFAAGQFTDDATLMVVGVTRVG